MEELTLIDSNCISLYSSLMDYTFKHADEIEMKTYHISERLLIQTLQLGEKGRCGYKLNKEIISFLKENYDLYKKIDLKFYDHGDVIYEHNAKTGTSRFAYPSYHDYIKNGHKELLDHYCF